MAIIPLTGREHRNPGPERRGTRETTRTLAPLGGSDAPRPDQKGPTDRHCLPQAVAGLERRNVAPVCNGAGAAEPCEMEFCANLSVHDGKSTCTPLSEENHTIPLY